MAAVRIRRQFTAQRQRSILHKMACLATRTETQTLQREQNGGAEIIVTHQCIYIVWPNASHAIGGLASFAHCGVAEIGGV